MKVLVTGGAGFIGSHVVDALIQRGDTVVVFDDLSYGKRINVSKKATFVKGSITNTQSIKRLFNKHKFAAIVHLAAQKNARHSIDDPVFDAEQNIIGSIHLLEQARKQKVKRFVFISTGGVMYGEAKKIPTPETEPAQPRSPYAIAKRSVEHYLEYYSEVHGISTIALRLANVFGPRQDPAGEAGVVAIFMSMLLKGKPPIIFGDGKQTRDYIYVDDAVNAILRAIDKSAEGFYNIGVGKQTSVNQLYGKIAKIAGIHKKVRHGKAVSGEQRTSALSSHRAKKALGWEATVLLNKGLATTWEWFSENTK